MNFSLVFFICDKEQNHKAIVPSDIVNFVTRQRLAPTAN